MISFSFSGFAQGKGHGKKWLIDETDYVKVPHSFEKKIREKYAELLGKYLEGKCKPVANYILPTLKHDIDRKLPALVFYKDKSGFDYIVETKIEVLKPDPDAPDYREAIVTIRVYDMEARKKIYEDAQNYNNASLVYEDEDEEEDEGESDLELAIDAATELLSEKSPKIRSFIHASMEASINRLAQDTTWNE